MKMQLNTKILVGFGGALLVLLLTSAASLWSIHDLRQQTDQVQRTYRIIQQADSLNALLREGQTGVRGYRLTYDTVFLNIYQNAERRITGTQDRLAQLMGNSPEQAQRLDSLRYLVGLEFGILRPLAQPTQGFSASDLHTILTTDRLTMLAVRRTFRRMKSVELALLDQRTHRQNGLEKAAPAFVLVSSVLAVVIVLWLFGRIGRELNDNQRLQTELQATNADTARRIGLIRELAERVVRGDYSVKVPAGANDSLGDLGGLLNQMTQSLDQHFNALSQRNDELDQFAYVASHDLKAPLRGVTTIVKWIEEEHDGELSGQLRTYLGQMRGRLQRLEDLINGLLAYARIGRSAQPPETVDVAALVREVAELVVPATFELALATPLPTLHTNRLGLQQVFTNLLSNAVKHHPHGTGHLAVSARELARSYEFRVQDDGAGIAPEYHQKIFQLFQTLRERHSAESTGIGLSIVRKIVEEQKGTIRVESAAGKGAVFIFTWPK